MKACGGGGRKGRLKIRMEIERGRNYIGRDVPEEDQSIERKNPNPYFTKTNIVKIEQQEGKGLIRGGFRKGCGGGENDLNLPNSS